MTFTEEQLEILSAWEKNFYTAVKAQWARNPGRAALQTIHSIYSSATGDKTRLNDNCQHCTTRLLSDCGTIYFRDKEELMNRRNDARAVEATLEDAKPVKKVAVKTASKKTTKKTKKD